MSQTSDPPTPRGIENRILLQAAKRNRRRLPPDFLFQLTRQEVAALRSQIVTAKARGGRRTPPYAFTEQGVAMLSSVPCTSTWRSCGHSFV